MKKYGALFVLSALLLAGCGAEYTAGQTAAESAEQPAAEINAAETGVTDPAGRTGYIDSNGIFIPDPSNSGRPDDFADEETVTEAYPADDTAPAADYGQKSAEQYQNQNENRQMRADAFCRALQINPLPEKLGGCTLQIDPDARFDPDKYTGYDEGYYTFPYVNESGDRELCVDIKQKNSFALECEPAFYAASEEIPTQAIFVSGNALIVFRAENYDPDDAERMSELTDTLAAALRSAVCHDLTDAEYFDALHINPMPDTLGDCKLKSEPDALHNLGEYNTFTYLNADGEPEMYAEICHANMSPNGDVYKWADYPEPAAAMFPAGEGTVTLKAVRAVPDDSERIMQLAKKLMQVLEKE